MPGPGGDAVSSSRAQARGRRKRKTPGLALDVLVEIAARSVDPAILVRCAATCRDMRRRAADETFRRRRRRRRRRHTTGRFVLPLLRGHLMGPRYGFGLSDDGEKDEQYLMDTTDAMATRLTRLVFPPTPHGEPEETFEPLDSRGGLVLLAVSDRRNNYQERRHLRVCDPATRRHSHTVPLGPPLSDSSSYVLLVGDEGRPFQFQVLEAKLTLSRYDRYARCLRIQTFSSEHGVWGPCTRIPTPSLEGGYYEHNELPLARDSKPLVVGDVVHWLCLTERGSYVLMLHVGATTPPRAKATTLPASFPRGAIPSRYADWNYSYLLATATAGGSPVVLVADDQKISAWPQCKETKIWKQRPWTVIDSVGEVTRSLMSLQVELKCFAETSGAVLIRIDDRGFFWLDLQSKVVVRQFSDPRLQVQKVYCSYEMTLSSWVPNFSCSVTL